MNNKIIADIDFGLLLYQNIMGHIKDNPTEANKVLFAECCKFLEECFLSLRVDLKQKEEE